MTTQPHTTLREVAERLVDLVYNRVDRDGDMGEYERTCSIDDIEAALVAERKRTIEDVAVHLHELGNKATSSKSWEPYDHCAAIVRALT